MPLHWQPFQNHDAGALEALLTRLRSVDPTRTLESIQDLHQDRWTVADLNAEAGLWEDTRLVGFVSLRKRDPAESTNELSLQVVIDPEWETDEVAVALRTWVLMIGCEGQLRPQIRAGLTIYASAHNNQSWLINFLEGTGFIAKRVFVNLRADLTEIPSLVPLSGHYSLVSYKPEMNESIRLACNDAFRGHWGTTPWTSQTWREDVTECDDFLPDLSFLLVDPKTNEVVTFVLCSRSAATNDPETRELYIDFVGTRMEMRRQGLASYLLKYTLAYAKSVGFDKAALIVDSDGSHKALELYQSMGFSVMDHFASFVLSTQYRAAS